MAAERHGGAVGAVRLECALGPRAEELQHLVAVEPDAAYATPIVAA